MKKSIAACSAAAILVAILAGPVAAARPSGGTLVTTACISGDQMVIGSTWSDEAVTDQNLFVQYPAKGPQLKGYVFATSYAGPFSSSGHVEAAWVKATDTNGNPIEWNTWQSFGGSTEFAFNDTAKTLRQPSGGWPACA